MSWDPNGSCLVVGFCAFFVLFFNFVYFFKVFVFAGSCLPLLSGVYKYTNFLGQKLWICFWPSYLSEPQFYFIYKMIFDFRLSSAVGFKHKYSGLLKFCVKELRSSRMSEVKSIHYIYRDLLKAFDFSCLLLWSCSIGGL